jgi:hypothetical protein
MNRYAVRGVCWARPQKEETIARDENPQRPATLETYRPGLNVTSEEIRQILADDGYSVGARTGWLKTLLTDITSEESAVPDQNKEKVVALLKELLAQAQNGKPKADDTL